MTLSPRRIGFAFLLLFATAGLAASVEEKYDDGKLKTKFSVDDKGRKDGLYQEFFPGGKIKCKAFYKADQLAGTYTEFDLAGKKTLAAVYKDGKLNGNLIIYEKGLPVLTQPFKDGEPAFAKSRDKIAAVLKELLSVPDGDKTDSREAALRKLKSYRFLCDVPYADVKLDDQYNRQVQAAAKVCEKLGRLDHNPPNPGLPQAEYKLALDGARHANLAGGGGSLSLSRAVDMWMFDSDPSNIERVGHRRWCLNPAMAKVGFGESGRFAAMYAHDQGRKTMPDFDSVCYPPRGWMPTGAFNPKMAWCFCPNPRKYRPADSSVKARVTAIDERFRKQGAPLELNFSKVDKTPVGLTPYCVIFRPDSLELADGKRYLVEIEGLKLVTGRPAGTVAYPVLFFELKQP